MGTLATVDCRMKVYVCTEDDVGFAFEDGLRFDVFTPSSPQEADCIIVPPSLNEIRDVHNQKLTALRYASEYPDKHVFYDVSDVNDTIPEFRNAFFLRPFVHQKMLADHPRTRVIPWPARSMEELSPLPVDGFRWDVSFVGWNSGPLRSQSAASCKEVFGDRAEICLNGTFFPYHDLPTQERLKQRFRDSIHYAPIVLAAPSVSGTTHPWLCCAPYRFYEALSAARVPVFIGDVPFLPFDDRIDWPRHYIFVPKERLANTGHIIKEWMQEHDPVAVGQENLRVWKEWLHLDDWPRTRRIMVEEMLRSPAC